MHSIRSGVIQLAYPVSDVFDDNEAVVLYRLHPYLTDPPPVYSLTLSSSLH